MGVDMKEVHSKLHSSGFTILEIMIVVVIIGVLASLALPKFYGMVERTRSVEAITVLQEMRMAMERCYISSMTYNGCAAKVSADLNVLLTGVNHHFALSGTTSGPNTWAIILNRNTHELATPDPGTASINCSPYFGGGGPSKMVACQNASGFSIMGGGFYEGIDTTSH